MRILALVYAVVFVGILHSCAPGSRSIHAPLKKETESSMTFYDSLFKNNVKLNSIIDNKDVWNVQVIYTKIDRTASNKPRLTSYTFNDSQKYFYPASTVKFPIALLALQRLHELEKSGINKNTTLVTEAGYAGQTPVYNDPTTPDGRPTIDNYIRKIFLVSDNDASNRLYEFLGQEYINAQLHQKGYTDAQILHRLAISLSEDENRHTNPVKFYDTSGKVIYKQDGKFNQTTYEARKDFLGKGYYAKDKLINNPMDFSKKNRISLASLHQMLISVVFPDNVRKLQRFRLTEEDRQFVLEQMSMFPGESLYPAYDTADHYNAYAKFLHHGAQRGPTPANIRIFNKVGNAYGQLVDVAYFCDFENKVEFFLSAAITCNTDGILNDDKYDYESIGFPFMKNLGEALYAHELQRKKKHLPDLSAYQFRYNK